MNQILFTLLLAGSSGSAEGGQQQGSPWMTFVFLGLIILIFYFFMIRPNQKAAKKTRNFLDTLSKGDKIITSSGLYGKIVEINDNTAVIEIANNVKIKITKSSIVANQDGTTDVKNENKKADSKTDDETRNQEFEKVKD